MKVCFFLFAQRLFASTQVLPAKYPIVLVHGLMRFADVLAVSYFFNVKNYLASLGYKVYAPQEDMFNTIEVRAQELANSINNILL